MADSPPLAEHTAPLASAFRAGQLARAIASGAAQVPFPRATDRAAWAGIDPASHTEILGHAEQAVAEPWPVLTLSQRLAFERTGSRRVFEAPYFDRRRRLIILALAHAVDPDPRWADAVTDGVGLLLEELSWCLPAHEAPPSGRRRRLPDPGEPVLDLFAAETAATLAWTGYLHHDLLSELGLHDRLRAQVTARVLHPFATRGREHWWFGDESNWNPWIVANLLTCATLLAADEGLAAAIVGQALESLDGYLASAPADGGCAEGIMYWWRSPACLFEAIDVLGWADPAGAAQVLAHPLLAAMARYPMLTHLGGDWWASLADGVARVPEPGPGIDKDRHPPALWYRFAAAVGETGSAALAASFPRALQVHQAAYRCLVTLFDPGWRSAPVTAAPPATDAWLPETMLLATSSSGHRLRLVAKGGHNDEPHNHLDVGSVVLAAGGEPVLIDVGTGQYTAASFSADRYAAWFTQSQFHCVPEVDGVAQGVGSAFRAEVLTQAGRELALELASAYPPEAGITSWRRSITLAEALQVTDTWQLDHPGRQVRVHLMLARVPEQTEGGWLLRGPSGVPRAVLTVTPSSPEAALTGRATAAHRAHLEDPMPTQGAAAPVSSAVEEIDLDDPILRGVWGAQLARLTLTVAEAPARGEITWTVRPVEAA